MQKRQTYGFRHRCIIGCSQCKVQTKIQLCSYCAQDKRCQRGQNHRGAYPFSHIYNAIRIRSEYFAALGLFMVRVRHACAPPSNPLHTHTHTHTHPLYDPVITDRNANVASPIISHINSPSAFPPSQCTLRIVCDCCTQWELKTGKIYFQLDPQGRAEANKDIDIMIENRKVT